LPPKFAAETADTVQEANDWLEGKPNARRPPELLTRDEVARSIKKEVDAGRDELRAGIGPTDVENVRRTGGRPPIKDAQTRGGTCA